MTATATAIPDREPFAWLCDPRHRRGSLELVRRAVVGDWPIPEADRAALVGVDPTVVSGAAI